MFLRLQITSRSSKLLACEILLYHRPYWIFCFVFDAVPIERRGLHHHKVPADCASYVNKTKNTLDYIFPMVCVNSNSF